MFTPAAAPKGVAGAITELLKTTAHIPKLKDTAPLGIYLHDGLPPLHIEKYLGVEGHLKAAFVRPEMQLRMEIWQRIEPASGDTPGQVNTRIILDSSGVVTYWDLGPSARRRPGGALESIGGFEQSPPIDVGNRRYVFRTMLKVLPHESAQGERGDVTSFFEMVPLTKQCFGPWKVSETDSHDYFRCSVEFPDKSRIPHLSISTHGWEDAGVRGHAAHGRLFRSVENVFRPQVADEKKIFD